MDRKVMSYRDEERGLSDGEFVINNQGHQCVRIGECVQDLYANLYEFNRLLSDMGIHTIDMERSKEYKSFFDALERLPSDLEYINSEILFRIDALRQVLLK